MPMKLGQAFRFLEESPLMPVKEPAVRAGVTVTLPPLDDGCIAQGEQCVASFAVVPDLPAVQAVAWVVIGIERPVLEALLPGEVPGKAGGPGIGRGVPQYRGVYGEGGGKGLIPVNQSERRIRNGEYGRGGRFGRGGNGADGKQHAQSQEKGEGPTARWIRMVMVEASFMKCGSQASSMEEILLLLLHRNRSPSCNSTMTIG